MDDVADAAGVAHGTVYTYFAAKEDVLLAVLDEAAVELGEAMAVPNVRDPHLRLEAWLGTYWDAHQRHAPVIRVAREAAVGDPRVVDLLGDLRRTFVARAALLVRRLQADGLARGDLDAPTGAAALCGMVDELSLQRPRDADDALAVRTLTQLWVRGLGMPENPALTRLWAGPARGGSRPGG